MIEESNAKCVLEMKECETKRRFHLTQIGNLLHPSVPIHDDEVHVNLVHSVVFVSTHSIFLLLNQITLKMCAFSLDHMYVQYIHTVHLCTYVYTY